MAETMYFLGMFISVPHPDSSRIIHSTYEVVQIFALK